jgi:hypothetical protein
VVSFTPHPLYLQGKSPWYPLDRRMGRSKKEAKKGVRNKMRKKGRAEWKQIKRK